MNCWSQVAHKMVNKWINEQVNKHLGICTGAEPEIKLPTSAGSSKKQENSRKNIYFCFIDYAKAFDCVNHNKLWKILKEMGIPDHLTCLLRNLYTGQEATVRTGDQNANICWIIEKAREFQKNIYFCFIDYAKAFDCVDHHKLWKILGDGNNRPPDLPPEKSVCRSGSNS